MPQEAQGFLAHVSFQQVELEQVIVLLDALIHPAWLEVDQLTSVRQQPDENHTKSPNVLLAFDVLASRSLGKIADLEVIFQVNFQI